MRACHYIVMIALMAMNIACAPQLQSKEQIMQHKTKLMGTHPLRDLFVADDGAQVVITKAQGRRLQTGDVIESVNGVAIISVAQLQQILQQKTAQWKIEFRRGDERFGLAVMP